MFKTVPTFFGPLVAIETDDRIGDELERVGHWEFQDFLEIIEIYQRLFSNKLGTILDIGCNIGTWTIPLAHRFSNNKVMAFDCQSVAIECVNRSVRLNHLANVSIMWCAISDVDQSVSYNEINYNWGANFGAFEFETPFINSDFNGKLSNNTSKIEVQTVDSLNIDHVSFIKIDVEGMEHKVLKGSAETIKRCRPMIVWEHHKTNRDLANKLLTTLGYKEYNSIGQLTLSIP